MLHYHRTLSFTYLFHVGERASSKEGMLHKYIGKRIANKNDDAVHGMRKTLQECWIFLCFCLDIVQSIESSCASLSLILAKIEALVQIPCT